MAHMETWLWWEGLEWAPGCKSVVAWRHNAHNQLHQMRSLGEQAQPSSVTCVYSWVGIYGSVCIYWGYIYTNKFYICLILSFLEKK